MVEQLAEADDLRAAELVDGAGLGLPAQARAMAAATSPT
jgi:hypothetical protein